MFKYMLICLVVIPLIMPITLQARILHVPGEYPTIQAGIDGAASGDTVLVGPGIYEENIRFRGRNVLVKSEMGPSETVIDGGNPSDPDSASCVMFVGEEGRDAIIDGFKLRNGGGVSRGAWGFYGGGVYSDGSSPTIRNNVITGNMPESMKSPGDTSGGGICCFDGSPLITHNLITGHSVSYVGGGIGISLCSAEIINNTIVGNGAPNGGGISFWRYSSSVIQNNIIVNSTLGAGIWCGSGLPDIRYNDVWNNAGGNYEDCGPGLGDIHADPLFVGEFPFMYNLQEGSPCIDKGDPGSPKDPDDTRADMGAYFFDQRP